MSTTPDLIVVSDLHIGLGKNPDTGRYFELEAFFYDDDFRSFCVHLCERAQADEQPFRLILNGDTFDLLRIDKVPGAGATTMRERRFGPQMTPEIATAMMIQIVAGHPVFLDALAHVLACGYDVIFLPGNHDLEIQWPSVEAEIRNAILQRITLQHGEEVRDRVAPQLQFLPWFYHEPGRVWIEHGCQYDPENAFRYLLRTNIESEQELAGTEVDLPLGNFFQRYLYNAFGHITFIVPSTRANLRYFKWLVVHQPNLLLRVFTSHARFWWQILRRVASTKLEAKRRLQQAHTAMLHELAETTGLGQRLHAIDALKTVRGDISQTVRSLGWQALRVLGAATLVGLLTLGLWFAGFHLIGQLRGGFFFKAALFLLLDFLFLLLAIGGVAYALLRSAAGPAVQPLRRAARRIAEYVHVPLVVFGHTHDEILWKLKPRGGGAAWYYNTGTWIAVFTHDVLLPRDRVQYTFLHIHGHEGELRHWSPGRGADLPVVLLDEHER